MIEVQKLYKHNKSGKVYKAILLTNKESTQPDKFPPSVVYQEVDYPFLVWSRPTIDFEKSFT